MISYKESAYDTNQVFWWFYLCGLFSSSPNLLTDNWDYTPSNGGTKWPMVGPLNRVPGAIDAELGGYIHQPEDNSNLGGGPTPSSTNESPHKSDIVNFLWVVEKKKKRNLFGLSFLFKTTWFYQILRPSHSELQHQRS